MNSPLIISPELINKLKSTEEYKRNSAISNSINYLIGKIEELTEKNSKLIKKKWWNEFKFKKINEKLFQFKTDNNLLKDESKLFKTKLNITEKLNNSLEETIKELNLKIENQEKNFNKKCENFNNILNEYKNIFEELKSEKETLEDKLKQAFNDINNCKELIQNYQIEINKLKSNKIALDILNKKIKSYEILMYKLDLENQNFKKDILNYRNQIAYITNSQTNEENFPIQKINLNQELDNIEKNYETIKISSSENINSESENSNWKKIQKNIKKIFI